MSASQPDALPRRVAPAPAGLRLAAMGLDAAMYLIIPAVLLPLGLLLAGEGVSLSPLVVNGIGLVLVIAPATAWAAWWETRPRGATLGKRWRRLTVHDAHTLALPSGRQSVARNVIKIAVAWELGHTVALGYANAAAGDVPSWLWVSTAVIYGWLLANLVLLIIPSHQPLHDRLAGSIVVRSDELVSVIT